MIKAGRIDLKTRQEMLDLIVVEGKARGIITRNLVTGAIERHLGDAVLLCTGGYGNVYYLSTLAINSNATAAWSCYKRGAAFADPCFTQIHPTCIPRSGDYQSKLTLMSESLRNDGRVWVSKKEGDHRPPDQIPEDERDYYLERKYPSFGNLVPRDVASRAAKAVCDDGRGVGETRQAVYLDFRESIQHLGEDTIRMRYGNLFDMYERITGENPYKVPMRIYPAVHYTMGGLWVDYGLMSTIPGLFVLGEANFSDHGGNRLGASALMQGLADGYFIIPASLSDYLAGTTLEKAGTDHPSFDEAESQARDLITRLLGVNGSTTVREFHRSLGKIMWEHVGMARNAKGLNHAIDTIASLREAFWQDVKVPGRADTLNKYLEFATRVADYMELGELLARDALHREESCGGHFREEFQTEEGEALRDDENFAHVTVWEYTGENKKPKLHKEELTFEYVTPTTRSYK